MRVLLLASAYPPTIGGAETYALNLRRGLEASGLETAVFTDGAGGEAPEEEDPRLTRANRYQALLDARDKVHWEQMQFSLLPELECTVREFRPSIIHANSHEAAILGSIAGISSGIPVVATFHEQSPERGPFGRGRCTLVYRFLPLVRIIAGSRYYYEKALAHGASRSRLELVPHGIDLERFCPGSSGHEQRRRWGYADREIVILCAARISPRKGQLELARAFAKVCTQFPQARLVLAGSCHSGSEAYLAALEAEIEGGGLAGCVHIDASISVDAMPSAYRAADIVVQPSKEEGLGLALIEAMACERAVVGTDVVGIREVITCEQVGLLVRGDGPVTLAEALIALCRDPNRRANLGRAARDHVARHFQLDRMAAATKNVYVNALTSWEKSAAWEVKEC